MPENLALMLPDTQTLNPSATEMPRIRTSCTRAFCKHSPNTTPTPVPYLCVKSEQTPPPSALITTLSPTSLSPDNARAPSAASPHTHSPTTTAPPTPPPQHSPNTAPPTQLLSRQPAFHQSTS